MTTAQDQQSREESVKQCHDAFHKHVLAPNGIYDRGIGWVAIDASGDYQVPETKARWLDFHAAWQAARALPADIEPLCYLRPAAATAPSRAWQAWENDGTAQPVYTAAQAQAMGRVPSDSDLVALASKHTRSVECATRYVTDAVAVAKEAIALWGSAAPRPPAAQVPIPSNSAGLERKPLDRIAVLVKIDAVLCKEKNPLQAAEEICAMANQGITHPTGA